MKKHIERPTKLTASECLALAVLRLSLERILESSTIVFTQVDLVSSEMVVKIEKRTSEIKCFEIKASFVDMETQHKGRPSVNAVIHLRKQKVPILHWEPTQVGMTIHNCKLKYPVILLIPDGMPDEGTIDWVIKQFAEDLNRTVLSNHSK